MFDWLKSINLKKVSLQTIFGGVTVYIAAKQQGATEQQAIIAGVISALTSGSAAAQNTQKPAEVAP